MSPIRRFAQPLIVVFLFLFPRSAGAQTYLDETGVPPFTTTLPVELRFVNLANGNLHIEIPVVSYPQRGKGPVVARFVYDSRIWQVFTDSNGVSNAPRKARK